MPDTPSVDTLIGDLLDAGASEEEIGAAVQKFKAVQATNSARPPKTHYDAQGKPYITDDPNDVQEPTPMKDAVFAGVQTLATDPLAAITADLKVPSMAIEGLAKAGPLVKGAMQAASRIALPVRKATGGALRTAGSVLESPLPNVVLGPRMEHIGKMLSAAGDAVSPAADVAPKLAMGAEVPQSVEAMASRASRIKTAPPARLDGADAATSSDDAAEALAAMKQKPTDLKSFLTGQRPPMPNRPASPLAAQMAQQEIPSASSLLDTLKAPAEAAGGGADLSSPLAQQMLQVLAERAPSTSKAGSAIPGLTEADIAVIEKVMRDARAARHAQHYEDAVSEAAAKRSVARGRPNTSK